VLRGGVVHRDPAQGGPAVGPKDEMQRQNETQMGMTMLEREREAVKYNRQTNLWHRI
jgi:hypothetical protein